MSDLLIKLLFAFVGGLLPALIWLWFWLKEDGSHPEPNKLILKTFFYGMLMVPVVFIFQTALNILFLSGNSEEVLKHGGLTAIIIVLIWAFIEEFAKYVAARDGGLKNKDNDEPIDVPIYLITAALGFSACENILFLISPLLENNFAGAFMTTNMRFVGATLVHISSSAIIGIFGAFSYFFRDSIKTQYLISGFVLATLLHALFNLFIMNSNDLAYLGFVTVWIFVVMIIIIFEKIKKIKINKIKDVW